jgi:hypothetical protein
MTYTASSQYYSNFESDIIVSSPQCLQHEIENYLIGHFLVSFHV